MAVLTRFLALLAVAVMGATAQSDESFQPPGQHPALLLNARRLRLLKRERERQSLRWRQFDALMTGGMRLPEPGFALALSYQVSGNEGAGRQAAEWALGPTADLRQVALVLDWCRPVLNDRQLSELTAKCERALEQRPSSPSASDERSRVFAALAIADRNTALAARELENSVVAWFRGTLAGNLKAGRNVLPRREMYSLLELLHAIHDNLGIDLRQSVPDYFATSREQNDGPYRMPAVSGTQSDIALAELARAADLSLTAYDPNSLDSQFLQGWLMHDRYVLRTPFGAPYEFLWANPYQPGLGYDKAPLWTHDPVLGRLFVRANWEDDAVWAGCFDGHFQISQNGQTKVMDTQSSNMLRIEEAAVAHVGGLESPALDAPAKVVFLVGLRPSTGYVVRIGRREIKETSDPGGILEVESQIPLEGAIRIREVLGR